MTRKRVSGLKQLYYNLDKTQWSFFVLEQQPGCGDVMRPSRSRFHFYPLCLTWSSFLKRPETFRAHFGDIIFFVSSKRRCSYFYFYSLYNKSINQLYRISKSEFYELLFGTFEKRATGLSICSTKTRKTFPKFQKHSSHQVFSSRAKTGLPCLNV